MLMIMSVLMFRVSVLLELKELKVQPYFHTFTP